MAPARSQRLHNFSLPYLKWGTQKFLRCVKVSSHGEPLSLTDRSSRDPFSKSMIGKPYYPIFKAAKLNTREPRQIEVIREKQCSDFPHEEPADYPSPAKPWNLRSRRAACRTPMEEMMNEVLTVTNSDNLFKNSNQIEGEQQNAKFSISLSRDEVEADFATMAGIKPPRRPKRRGKTVQKCLDSLFPGLWLAEVTPESYKVSEFPDTGKG